MSSELLAVPSKLMLAASGYRINHSPNIFIKPVFLCQSHGIFQQRTRLAIEPPECLEYPLLLPLAEAGPIQTSPVNAPDPRRIMSADSQERRDIPIDPGQTRCIGPLAEGNKLVRCSQTAEPSPGFNLAMPAYLHQVAHNNLVFNNAIVSDVYADHEEILIAYFRHCVRTDTRMDCHLFVDDVSITYYKSSDFDIRTQAQDLRLGPNHAIGKKVVIPTYPDILVNHHIGIKYSVGSD